jgi:hypothetical protein
MVREGHGPEFADPGRLFKEAELQVWKQDSGRFALLKTYRSAAGRAISARRVREGDRRAPEGFYAIAGADEPAVGPGPLVQCRLSKPFDRALGLRLAADGA